MINTKDQKAYYSLQNNRKFVGFELNNKEYKELIKENIKSHDLDFTLVKVN